MPPKLTFWLASLVEVRSNREEVSNRRCQLDISGSTKHVVTIALVRFELTGVTCLKDVCIFVALLLDDEEVGPRQILPYKYYPTISHLALEPYASRPHSQKSKSFL